MALGSALVRQWYHRQTGTHTRTEVPLVHLAVQGIGCSRVDEVPKDIKHSRHTLLIGIHLSVLLVVESLQFQDFPILPVATFIILGDVIQFRIETEHVEVQRLTLDILHRCLHVSDKLTRSRSGRMHTDSHHRAFQGFPLLGFGRSGSFRSSILVPIHRINQDLISLNHRVGNLLVEFLDHVLTSTRITDDKDAVIQAAHQFRFIPEMIPGSGHQRSEKCR